MPTACGLASSFWTMRLSFSPASTIGAVLADRLPHLLESLGVGLLQRLQRVDAFGALLHHQFDEASRACRRWAAGRALRSSRREATDRSRSRSCRDWRRACRPGIGNFLGERQEDLLLGEAEIRTGLGIGDGQAVEADLDLDDVGDAVLGAIFELALLDLRARHW